MVMIYTGGLILYPVAVECVTSHRSVGVIVIKTRDLVGDSTGVSFALCVSTGYKVETAAARSAFSSLRCSKAEVAR